ncbi:hypothetical protein TKK_0015652 [Trichogramma kaykai]|uniref:Uncharacterized protein n=1 Tax=Trichogramma kaykai TaxID=54128 RepID=A0ABD2WAP4_9HYME
MPTVQDIVATQVELAKNITNFLVNSINKLGPDKRTLVHFEAREKLLEKYWDSFCNHHNAIIPHLADIAASSYVTEDTYAKVEEEYLTTKAVIRENINELTVVPRPNSITPNVSVASPSQQSLLPSLPKIQLPTFSGKQEDWESFKHRFTALIISQQSMPQVTKLQHLLSSLQSDAEHRVKGLLIIDSNFNVAWDRLVRRYDNLSIRLSTHLEALITLPSVRNRNARNLASLIDKAEESVQALRDLRCFEEEKSHFIVHCLLRKLDISTKEAWNVLREGKDDFPFYKDLLCFLEQRLQTLEQT